MKLFTIFHSTITTVQNNIPLNNQAHRYYCYAVEQQFVEMEKLIVSCDDISLLLNFSESLQTYHNIVLQHSWLSLALYAHTKNLATYSTKDTLVVTETTAHKSMGSHNKPACLTSASSQHNRHTQLHSKKKQQVISISR